MHIDGSMNATEKESRLSWLRAEPQENKCKILFNVRCLSEGVDVPSLDAVVFLSPRKSPVEVVQTVGRVMRIAPNKKRGYVILPIVVQPSGIDDLILNKNKDFDIVWEILNALKSIDPTLVEQLMARQVKSILKESKLFLSLIKSFPIKRSRFKLFCIKKED